MVETNPTTGKDKENSEDQKNCRSSRDENENNKISNNPKLSSAVSRKRSPNTRTSSGGGGSVEESSKSKRHLGLSTADNQQQLENKDNSNHNQETCSTVVGVGGESKSGCESSNEDRSNMETDTCATEIEGTEKISSTSASSSNASSGYSSSRSNKINANTPKPHLSRGMSKSAGESGSGANGKENRVPSSLMASHSQTRGGGDSLSPIPIIKNRPQRSFVGYVSPYEQFLRFTETDPKYRSEKSQGKILGLYKFCGEIGSGNFSKVKLGIHQLTKGIKNYLI